MEKKGGSFNFFLHKPAARNFHFTEKLNECCCREKNLKSN